MICDPLRERSARFSNILFVAFLAGYEIYDISRFAGEGMLNCEISVVVCTVKGITLNNVIAGFALGVGTTFRVRVRL